ncbi:MAG TPA: carboxypeptidase-like regulatory domain-containing protein [Ohtaekwangia sp.]|nr:carboxypeptidase-like regulatory domain-containing protein [Ohtaekwangia sp.]
MKYLALFLTLLHVTGLAGQDFITISGRVLDHETNTGLSYAHIIVTGRPYGTVSNEYGEFAFHIPADLQSDTLIISFIGYTSLRESIRRVVTGNKTQFYLRPHPVILEGVTVTDTKITALEIIQQAQKKITENYASDVHVLQGFFRDWKAVDFATGEKDNGVLVESAVNILAPGYGGKTKLRDRVYIKEIRRSELPPDGKWNYYNSLSDLLGRNFIRNKAAKDFPNPEAVFSFPNSFSFEYDRNSADAHYTVIDAWLPGAELVYKFYINPELAVERIDFVSKRPFIRGDWNIKSVNNTQRFREWKGNWYLSYIRRNWEIENFDIKTGKLLRRETYLMELLVNNIIHKDSIREENLGDLSDARKPLEFQLKDYNAAFWKNYNIVLDNPLEDSIRKLFERERSLSDQFSASARETSPPPSAAGLPEQVTDDLKWVVGKSDSLQGSLNAARTCYDVNYYDLTIAVIPAVRQLKGTSGIYFTVNNTTAEIQIDLNAALTIDNILWEGKSLAFRRTYNAVFIRFPQALLKGTRHNVVIGYAGTPLEADLRIPHYGAFVWTKDPSGDPWIQSICQGSGANGWWPNKDHFSDKPDSVSITITAPSGLINVSNGSLVSEEVFADNTTSKWKITYPVLNYNVALNIGNYVTWRESFIGKTEFLISLYALKDSAARARDAFKIVQPMLRAYENFFGPYPFPKDGFKLVQTPYPMEHQSCVAVGEKLEEDIILHEAAHEWWGNSVSCTDPADIWIHEAFATYAVALFKEFHYGPANAMAYFDYLKKNIKGEHPLVGMHGINHIHYDIGDTYTKGALLLHTVRTLVDMIPFGSKRCGVFNGITGTDQSLPSRSSGTSMIKHRTTLLPFSDIIFTTLQYQHWK